MPGSVAEYAPGMATPEGLAVPEPPTFKQCGINTRLKRTSLETYTELVARHVEPVGTHFHEHIQGEGQLKESLLGAPDGRGHV